MPAFILLILNDFLNLTFCVNAKAVFLFAKLQKNNRTDSPLSVLINYGRSD